MDGEKNYRGKEKTQNSVYFQFLFLGEKFNEKGQNFTAEKYIEKKNEIVLSHF